MCTMFKENNLDTAVDHSVVNDAENREKELLFAERVSSFLNSEEFREEIWYFDAQHRETIVGSAIEYLILHKDTDNLDSFWQKLGSIEKKDWGHSVYHSKFEDFLVQSIADKLGLEYPFSPEGEEKAYAYALENFVLKGYYFHGFNGVFEESIKKNGLSPIDRLWDTKELRETSEIGLRYGNKMLLGWHALNSEQKIFLDFDADSVYRYGTVSPEWFAQFVGENIYISDNGHGNKNAFCRRDYETAKENVGIVCDHMKVNQEDRLKLFNVFEKYWKLLASQDSSPKVALVKTTAVFEKEKLEKRYKDAFPRYIEDQDRHREDNTAVHRILRQATFGHDLAFDITIPPESLVVVDMPSYWDVYPDVL